MAPALFQAIVSGLAVGGAYALVALGFSITFTTTKTLNFSHGEFVSAGAFIGVSALFLTLGMPLTATTFGDASPGCWPSPPQWRSWDCWGGFSMRSACGHSLADPGWHGS
jgi:hypothetical protein